MDRFENFQKRLRARHRRVARCLAPVNDAPRRQVWRVARIWLGLALLLAVLPLHAWTRAQEGAGSGGQSPAATAQGNEREQRLQEIEKTLRQLIEEVNQLRGAPPASTAATQQPTAEVKAPAAPPTVELPESWLKAVTWRPIGPANMSGRIVDLAVYPGDPSLFWVATASGGLLKTTNNGITFEHQFDKEATVSIGAIAVAPTDANIVWVGTGENNPRNSVSYGDGVYKSTDGGKTWKNMGLHETYQIGRVIVHPKDPNIVYVGALGRLYGPNAERGVYKTTDGGVTWQKSLFVDDKTGVIDLVMHPEDPETLIAAMWERRRDEFDSWPGSEVPLPEGYNGYDPIEKWGPGGGIYKTTNGGGDWKKLTEGLPSSKYGRIGLDWNAQDPNVVYAVIDCENIGKGPAPQQAYSGIVGENTGGRATVAQVIPDSPAAKAGVQPGDLIMKVDDQEIDDFDKLLDLTRKRKPNEKVKLQLARGDDQPTIEITLSARPGQGSGTPTRMWIGAQLEDRQGKITLVRLMPDAPASQAGLAVDDVITSVDGAPIADSTAFNELVRGRAAGDKLKLSIARGETTKEVEVAVQDMVAYMAARGGGSGGRQIPQGNAFMGIQGEDAEGGARLTSITEGGPSEKAGLKAGDLITKINGKPVDGYEALVAQIRQGQPDDKWKVTVQRGEETKEVEVTLAARQGDGSRLRPYGFSYGGQSPNIQDQQGAKGFEYGGIYRSSDAGETWKRINSLNSRPMYFSVVRVDPSDEQFVYVLGVEQYRSSNGGQTFSGDFGRGVHADGHSLWIDPRDGRHMIIGVDGGIYVTYDRGANWDHLNHMAIGQFYHVAISAHEPYYVTGGLQDNGTWLGPSLSKNGSGPLNEDWISVGGGDGFMCRVDPEDPDLIYYTSQDGNMARRNLRTGERASIRPRNPENGPGYRFNWNTPFILSHHNAKIFYSAGNYVFRSLNKGDGQVAISPEITLTKRGSGTALSESPRNPNVLYVGTDDGALWVTRDGGREWKEVSKNVGLPGPRWVATLEASRFAEGRVYAAFDGHRSDDDDPHVYVSQDYGETWTSLRSNLPRGSTRCLREDTKNENLLLLGSEFGAWFSLDRGQKWNKFNTNLPTVAIHELAVHPNNGELVAATHGRSIWITDISALRQIAAENLADKIALYAPETTIRWMREPSRGGTNRRFVGTNPPSGAQIYYSLPKDAQQAALKVIDVKGDTLRELAVETKAGLHRVSWDLSRVATPPNRGGASGQPPAGAAGRTGRSRSTARPMDPAETPSSPMPPKPAETAGEGSPTEAESPMPTEATQTPPAVPRGAPSGFGGMPGGGRSGFVPGGGGRPVPAGTYRLVLTVDGQEFSQTVQVLRDPNAPEDAVGLEDQTWEGAGDEEEEEEREREESSPRRSDHDD